MNKSTSRVAKYRLGLLEKGYRRVEVIMPVSYLDRMDKVFPGCNRNENILHAIEITYIPLNKRVKP